ncbi:hypothetical protein [Streptomyces sp. NPDC056387]|uniref:hypothetical protein n=1 Tax=Streptomyces sp. NPDC056387 TaxID=3345803 RepID=UPI0035E100E7
MTKLLPSDAHREDLAVMGVPVHARANGNTIHQAASLSALLDQFLHTGWKWDDADPSPS